MKWFLITGTALVLAGCQQAATRNSSPVSVTATGTPLRLNFFSSLNADCSSLGPIPVRVIQPPVNGTVSVVQAQDYPRYNSANQRYHCNARRVTGTRVVYTPRAGFVGQETIVVEGFYPSGTADRLTHTVNIR